MQLIYFLIYLVLGMLLTACHNSAAKHFKRLTEVHESQKLDEQHKASFRLLCGSWVTIAILLTLAVNLCVVFDKKVTEQEQRIESLKRTVSNLNLLETITLEEAIDRTENQ
ncbi:MAG: hypothetical protein J6W60_13735 [Treponema sp.]|nr:hypothetical protein [Treponema sp.]